MSGIIKRHLVSVATASRSAGVPAVTSAGDPKATDSRVELIEGDDSGTRIRVTCACGQVTTIDCDYDEEPETDRPFEGDR